MPKVVASNERVHHSNSLIRTKCIMMHSTTLDIYRLNQPVFTLKRQVHVAAGDAISKLF